MIISAGPSSVALIDEATSTTIPETNKDVREKNGEIICCIYLTRIKGTKREKRPVFFKYLIAPFFSKITAKLL